MEKPADAGNPVVTVNTLDCVLSAGDAMFAVTRTDVCWVPELTTVCTVPSVPDVAVAGERADPADRRIETECDIDARARASGRIHYLEDDRGGLGQPRAFQADRDRRGRYELNGRRSQPRPPLPCPVAVRLLLPTVAVAVMTSAPLQPFAVYVALTLPVEVITVPGVGPAALPPEAAIVANPCATQGELNVTVTVAAVYSVPVWSTIVTLRLAVPPAEREVLESSIIPAWKPLPLPLPIE